MYPTTAPTDYKHLECLHCLATITYSHIGELEGWYRIPLKNKEPVFLCPDCRDRFKPKWKKK